MKSSQEIRAVRDSSIEALYASGETLQALSRIYRLTSVRIMQILHERGVQMRPIGRPRAHRSNEFIHFGS